VAGFIEGNRSHIFIQIISQIKKRLATSPSVSQGLFGISIRLEKPSWWFFFSHNIAAWDPRSWGYEEAFVPPFIAAMMSALFTWVGFYIPQDLHRISMDGKSWKVFFSDTLGNLLTLIVSALILVYWK